jgi:Calpain family cysteine protease
MLTAPQATTATRDAALSSGSAADSATGVHATNPSAQALRLAANPRQPGAYPGSQTQLFMPGVGDPRAIEFRDVRQGSAGTCTILAASMSLASKERGRMWLTRNLRDDGNGNITVTLWNKPMSIPIDKIKTMPAGVGDFNFNPADPRWEIWPKAMEAGYTRGGKWLFGVEFYRSSTVGSPNIDLALRAISGPNRHVAQTSRMTREQLFRDVGAALNDQKVVIAATVDAKQITPVQAEIAQQYGLHANHAYAVLGVNAKNDSVWLGDPHGRTLSISLPAFREFFPAVGWGYIP